MPCPPLHDATILPRAVREWPHAHRRSAAENANRKAQRLAPNSPSYVYCRASAQGKPPRLKPRHRGFFAAKRRKGLTALSRYCRPGGLTEGKTSNWWHLARPPVPVPEGEKTKKEESAKETERKREAQRTKHATDTRKGKTTTGDPGDIRVLCDQRTLPGAALAFADHLYFFARKCRPGGKPHLFPPLPRRDQDGAPLGPPPIGHTSAHWSVLW